MRPARGEGGKVWIRGFLYGKHLHWSWRYCAFTVVWLKYLRNYKTDTAPIAHPACSGTQLWVIQGCRSMFRNMSPFPKAVTLFNGGYSKRTFATTVFCHQFECQLHIVYLQKSTSPSCTPPVIPTPHPSTLIHKLAR